MPPLVGAEVGSATAFDAPKCNPVVVVANDPAVFVVSPVRAGKEAAGSVPVTTEVPPARFSAPKTGLEEEPCEISGTPLVELGDTPPSTAPAPPFTVSEYWAAPLFTLHVELSVQVWPLTVAAPLPGKSVVAMDPHSGAVAAPLDPVETRKLLVLEVLPPRRVAAPLAAP